MCGLPLCSRRRGPLQSISRCPWRPWRRCYSGCSSTWVPRTPFPLGSQWRYLWMRKDERISIWSERLSIGPGSVLYQTEVELNSSLKMANYTNGRYSGQNLWRPSNWSGSGRRNELNHKKSLVAHMRTESYVTSQNALQMAATACSTEEIMPFYIEIALILCFICGKSYNIKYGESQRSHRNTVSCQCFLHLSVIKTKRFHVKFPKWWIKIFMYTRAPVKWHPFITDITSVM